MPKKLTLEQKEEQKKKRLAYAKQYYLKNRDRLVKYAREKCKYASKRIHLENDDPTKGKAFKRISKKDPDFSRSKTQKDMIELPPKKPRKAPLPPKQVKKTVATSSKDDAKKKEKPKPVIKKTKKKFIIKEPKKEEPKEEETTAKTRVTELYKLILKLNNSKNNLVNYKLNFPSVKKYNNELNDYETKIKNITKNLIEKTFNKKYDVSLVRRGEGDTIEYIYMLVINAKEFDFSRMILLDVMDDLKPYLKIKNLTEKENNLLIKVLNEPKPVFNDKYKKALRKEKDEENEPNKKKDDAIAKTRVTELYKLIKKLNNSKNNDYETKIKNITKKLMKNTFIKTYNVSLVRRGEGDTTEYIYVLVTGDNEFDFSRMSLLDAIDDLKPYLQIKKLTETDNNLLIKALKEPKPKIVKTKKKIILKPADDEPKKEEPTAKTPEDLIILIQMADEVNKMASLKHIQKSKSLDELRKLEKKYNEKEVKFLKYLKGLSSKYPVKELRSKYPTLTSFFSDLKKELKINISKVEEKISDVYNDTTKNFYRRIKAQLIKLKVDNFNIILNERIEKDDKEKEEADKKKDAKK